MPTLFFGISLQLLRCSLQALWLAEKVGNQQKDVKMIAKSPVHTALEKFENAAFFLRLGLPSTLIRHENGAFRKRFSEQRKLKTPALRFTVDGKHFQTELSENDDVIITLPEFPSKRKAFSNSSGVVRTENIWCVFRVMTPFSNFSGVVWTCPKAIIDNDRAKMTLKGAQSRFFVILATYKITFK